MPGTVVVENLVKTFRAGSVRALLVVSGMSFGRYLVPQVLQSGRVTPIAGLAELGARVTGREPFATREAIKLARKSLMKEISPIDDIRSTANYRQHVSGNLLVDFLWKLRAQPEL